MEEISAGGVVIEGDTVLTLRKYQGDWVLPKGRLEANESSEEAAIREVYEESGIMGEIKKYIGYLKYNYIHGNGERVNKTVHYYLMTSDNTVDATPQKEEGFMEAVFMDIDKVMSKLKHEAEKTMVKKAFEIYKNM
ncbi:MAG: NUDIX domain-containing protein [Tissierellia bacterium]|nr:NUDIX domain-containing protein [Tissierellia bacterium]